MGSSRKRGLTLQEKAWVSLKQRFRESKNVPYFLAYFLLDSLKIKYPHSHLKDVLGKEAISLLIRSLSSWDIIAGFFNFILQKEEQRMNHVSTNRTHKRKSRQLLCGFFVSPFLVVSSFPESLPWKSSPKVFPGEDDGKTIILSQQKAKEKQEQKEITEVKDKANLSR